MLKEHCVNLQFSDGVISLHMWKVSANVMNKQSRMAENGGSSNFGNEQKTSREYVDVIGIGKSC